MRAKGNDAALVWAWAGLGALLLVMGGLFLLYDFDGYSSAGDLISVLPVGVYPLIMGILSLIGASGLSSGRPQSRQLLRYVSWVLLVVPPSAALIGLLVSRLATYPGMDVTFMFVAWPAYFVVSLPFYVAGGAVAASHLLRDRTERRAATPA